MKNYYEVKIGNLKHYRIEFNKELSVYVLKIELEEFPEIIGDELEFIVDESHIYSFVKAMQIFDKLENELGIKNGDTCNIEYDSENGRMLMIAHNGHYMECCGDYAIFNH